MKILLDLVRHHKQGEPKGIYSVCSAHPLVIEAALRVGQATDQAILIEATSNQVNQDGGYTGMTPQDFREFVFSIAKHVNFPRERILLGGDHLGPNCWQAQTAELAMEKSKVLIEQYIAAGFRKIHLDCSMSCADDPSPLPDATIAKRAASLCAIAESTWKRVGGEAPVYIVGTEVPVPGGAHEDLQELAVTHPSAAAATIAAHRTAFAALELTHVWPRVIALVVQPGVEFDHDKVIDYLPEKAAELSRFIESETNMVFEAHSTDYQTTNNLKALVRDHYAILKVGPGLTYALRETLWALAELEQEWIDPTCSSNFKHVVLAVMRAQPGYWNKYYCHTDRQRFDMQFSLSDRIRYYWPHPEIQAAQNVMLANLSARPAPLTLLSQYLPDQYEAIRNGHLRNDPLEIINEGIAKVLRQYHYACAPTAPIKESAVCQ